MDVSIELCTADAYADLARQLGGIRHACASCGSALHGQPHVDQGHISVSHSGALHLVALADEPVGVDAEPSRMGDGIEDVALHPSERLAIERLDGALRRRAVLEVWVAKEAALKLVGTGLQIAPETFAARHADGWYVAPGTLWQSPIYLSVTELDEHVVAVATFTPSPQLVVRRHTSSYDGATLERH